MKRNWKRTISLLIVCIMFLLVQTPISFASKSDAAEGPLVMSEKETAGSVITAFADLEESAFWFEGEPSEKELVEGLPAYLKVDLIPDAEDVYDDAAESKDEDNVKAGDGTAAKTAGDKSANTKAGKKSAAKKDADSVRARIPVSWKIVEDYGETEYYFYSAKPVLPKGCKLAKDLDPLMDVPWITLYRKASSEQVDEGEPETKLPVEKPQQLEPVYTEAEGSITADEDQSGQEAGGTKGSSGTGKASGTKGTKQSKKSSPTDRQKRIYNYLTNEMGLNMAAACAVMTNLYAESGMQPNNLENTYNAAYGLSDREYTRRVNKGKKHNGRYVSGYGKTRYFTTDYCGYGICQWTSLSRRKNLLKRAIKKDTSIGNLDMQLGFLRKELKSSYPQVWATLKGVPNNAAGVYLASMHFCVAFEIPANTNATAASRAKTALATFWKTYSGKTASTRGKSFLGICGYSYPAAVKKGVGVTCSGHVISNYTIKKVSAKIVTAKGKTVCSSKKRPGTTVYSLYNFDRSMTFSKLSPGVYSYIIKARDSHGKSVKVKHSFRVTEGGKTIVSRGCAVKNVTASSLEQ